jgi:hypothetical protein
LVLTLKLCISGYQHYDTLQAIGADTNSNLILLPNSPQAGSDMLNNMVASFASNMVGESMKKTVIKQNSKIPIEKRKTKKQKNRSISYNKKEA